MAYKRKTFDRFEVQQRTSQGWEDVYSADSRKDARTRLKEYRENQPEYPARIKTFRQRIPGHFSRRIAVEQLEPYVALHWPEGVPTDCTMLDAKQADCLDRNKPPCESCRTYDQLVGQFYKEHPAA